MSQVRRKVTAVTGSRAEYGILYPVLKAIQEHPALELSLVATGMHLSQEFGYTVQEIKKDGFPIAAEVDMLLSSDTSAAMAKSIALGILGMAQAFQELQPEIILLLGDRVEPLAAAIAGAYMNIAVAHIHGGDSPRGGLDEYARHAITKLAHLHFPATEASAERIRKMGEEEERIHLVVSPALDYLELEELPSPEEVARKFSLKPTPLILVVQHPVTTQVDESPQQIRETLEALRELAHQTILIYPNADAGGRRMIEVIKEYERLPFLKTFKSLPHREYLGLMKVACVLVGNSSSAIIEAPSLGLPAVNIGIRQEGRERGKNLIDAPHQKEKIIEAIKKALSDQAFLAEVKKSENPYGKGGAGKRIAEILAELKITPQLFQKKLTY